MGGKAEHLGLGMREKVHCVALAFKPFFVYRDIIAGATLAKFDRNEVYYFRRERFPQIRFDKFGSGEG